MRKMEIGKKMFVFGLAAVLAGSMSLGGMTAYAEDDSETEEFEVESSSEDETVDDSWDESEEEDELEISQDAMRLSVGGSSVLDVDGDYDSVEWSSNKRSVATVNSNGKVKAVKTGTAVITAKVICTVYNEDDAEAADEYDYFIEESYGDAESEDDVATEDTWDEEAVGEEVVYTLKCKVTVAKGAVLSSNKLSVKVGKSVKLKVTGAAGTKVKWGVKNAKIARVKNGKVKAIKRGNTVITAKVGSKVLKCRLKVK